MLKLVIFSLGIPKVHQNSCYKRDPIPQNVQHRASLWKDAFVAKIPLVGVLPKRTSINWFGGLKKTIGN
jgi:hypothetical protein